MTTDAAPPGVNAHARRLLAAAVTTSVALVVAAGAVMPLAMKVEALGGETTERWTYYASGNEVNDLAIDPRTGEVWAATTGGAVVWDPATAAHQQFSVLDGLADSNVLAVAIDAVTGDKWFGTESGVNRLGSDGRWSTLTTADGLAGTEVQAIAIDTATGDKWFGTWKNGASRLGSDGQWTTFASADGLLDDGVWSIGIDRTTGDRWFGTENGISRLNSAGLWTTFTSPNNIPVFQVTDIAIDAAAGDTWFATLLGAVRLTRDGTWTLPFDTTTVTSVSVDVATGSTWIGTYRGASRLSSDGRWTDFVPADGLAHPVVQSIATDVTTGDTWFGTRGGGISRLSAGGRWSTFSSYEGPIDNNVYSIVMDGATGDKWFGTYLGVSRLAADGRWTTFTSADGLADIGVPGYPERYSNVLAIAIDTETGDKWFATEGGASRLAADGRWATFTTADGLAGNVVKSIAIDPSTGEKWFASWDDNNMEGGVSRLDAAGRWTTFTSADGLAGDSVSVVAIDTATGDKWFGTSVGASRLTAAGRWTTFTSADGMAADTVWAIAIDTATGDKWFGTAAGASRLAADGRWTTFSVADGLAHNTVIGITIDAATGDKWFGTSGGVSRLNSDGRWTTLSTADGLGHRSVWTVTIDATTGDKWMALTGSGISVLSENAPAPASCSTAAPLINGADIVTTLERPAETDYYSIDVLRPFTHIQVSIPDPENTVGIEIFRACDASIGTGSGRHIGTGSGRHIGGVQQAAMDVGFRTGRYYVAVYPRSAAAQFPLRYHLQLSLGELDLEYTRTLILTSAERVADLWKLDAASPELIAWQSDLNALVRRRDVGGLVVGDIQYDTDPEVEKAYKRWMDDDTDPRRANDVARALRAWIDRVVVAIPGIRYVVIAGDDRVVPHFRLPIVADDELDDGWQRETGFMDSGDIDPNSTVGSALRKDYTLSDDVYAAREPVMWGGDQPIYVPELAVGRLVERPSDMSAAIQAYVEHDGDLRVGHSLAAGYDFMQDGVEAADAALSAAGLGASRRTRLLGNALTVPALRQQLFTNRQDLAFLGVHATHQRFELPNHLPMRSDAVTSATADLGSMIAFGLACHTGLNTPGEGHKLGLDFPEAWQRRGATWIGSTGWAYGMDRFLAYQEDLMASFAKGLASPSPVRLGDALVNAKRAYYLGHEMNAMHAKTLAATVLYGLPMLRVRVDAVGSVASTRAVQAPDSVGSPDVVAAKVPPAPARLTQVGRAVLVDRDRRYSFAPTDLARKDEPDGSGSYYTFSGQRPRAEAGEPVQPRETRELGRIERDGIVYEPRAIMLVGGTYRDEPGFTPLVQSAGVMSARPDDTNGPHRAARFSATGWYPRVPVQLQRVSAWQTTPSQALLQFTVGQYEAATETERLFSEVVLDEYYSTSADRSAPAVTDVVSGSEAGVTSLHLTATDASDIERSLVAYTIGDGRWQSIALTSAGDGHWSGSWPISDAYIVQMVDGAGNVTTIDDGGHVRRPCVGVCEGSIDGPTTRSVVWLPLARR